MELRQYVRMLRQRLLLILLIMVVGAMVGVALTSQRSVYSTTATIYVGPSKYSLDPSGAYTGANQIAIATSVIPTYAKMLASGPLAASAAQQAKLSLSAAQVLADTAIGTEPNVQLLQITETDTNPLVAQNLANALASTFVAKISSLPTQPGLGSVPAVPAYVFSNASLPTVPQGPKLTGNAVKGGLAGVVVGVGLAALLEYLDVTLKDPLEAEREFDLPVLGVIPLLAADG